MDGLVCNIGRYFLLACVASVSNRVMARKLEREQKKGGIGKGREETLARKPHDSGERP